MRKKVNESLTRSKVVAEISALKSEELSIQMGEKLAVEFDVFETGHESLEVLGDLVALAEKHQAVLKQVMGTTNRDVRK